MEKMLKRRTKDCISDLPESVLLHILSLLNMKEVVKTCVLSKKWEYIWTSVPTLTFEYIPEEFTSKYNLSLEFKERIGKNMYGPFITWVNKTILQCQHETIRKLHVKFYYTSYFAGDVDVWVKFAAQTKLRDISLQLKGCHVYNLPRSLCHNSHLLNLSISNCTVGINIDFFWTSLRNLSIAHMTLHDDTITKILSGSPMLEILKISKCQSNNGLYINSKSLRELVIKRWIGESVIEISAPNIQTLHILGELFKGQLRLNLPSLYRAELNCPFNYDYSHYEDGDNEKQCRCNFMMIIKTIRQVVELEVGLSFVQNLSLLGEKNLSSRFSSLTCLKVSGLIDKTDVVGIISLLKCSPNLEKLVVNKEPARNYFKRRENSSLQELAEKYWESERRTEKFALPRLNIVKLNGFKDVTQFTNTLVQFLLENAVLLGNIVIKMEECQMIVKPRVACMTC